MDKHSLTTFRANIYSLVDGVINSGQPLLLERNGHVLEVKVKALKRRSSKKLNDLSKIVPLEDALTEDAEFYRHIEWNDWHPNIDI